MSLNFVRKFIFFWQLWWTLIARFQGNNRLTRHDSGSIAAEAQAWHDYSIDYCQLSFGGQWRRWNDDDARLLLLPGWHSQHFDAKKNCVVMEFAEMNYYKCKIEDEENAAFLDLARARVSSSLSSKLTFRIRGASNLYFRTLWRSSHMHTHAASSTFDLQLHF